MKETLIIALFLIVSVFTTPITAPIEQSIDDTKLYKEYYAKKEQEKRASEFERFLNHLGYKESRNNWKVYNKYGYIGEFQFGKTALKATGYSHVTYWKFRKDPSIFPKEEQRKAVCKLIDLNMKHIGKFLDKYEGKEIKGIIITKSGVIAATHLGGAGGVKMFLESNGTINKKDAYGTSIKKYLKEFAFYDF